MSTIIREFYYSQLKQCFLAFQFTSQLCPILLLFPFAGSKVLLCDFHRENAWLEWTSKSDNGVASIKETILDLLRKVAHAVTTTDSAAQLLRIFRTANSGMIMKSLESGLGKGGYLTLR